MGVVEIVLITIVSVSLGGCLLYSVLENKKKK